MSKKLPIRYRRAIPEDANFIFNSWLKSYRNSNFARFIDNTIYFNEQHKLLESLLKSCEVVVACSESDPNQIYGYAVSERIDGFLVIHYIYVKHSFRNMGIGTAILNTIGYDKDAACVFTMRTRILEKILFKYNMVYHPYLAFEKYKGVSNEHDGTEEKLQS